jgi:hypothetical protein
VGADDGPRHGITRVIRDGAPCAARSGDVKTDDIVPVSRSQPVALTVATVAPSVRAPSTCGMRSVDPELPLERRTGEADRRRYTRTDRRRKLTG